MKPEDSPISELFDKAARTYASLYDEETRVAHFFQSRLRRLHEMLDEERPGKVLDIGCGPGLLAEGLSARGFDYCGVDISAGMISECQERFGSVCGAKFERGDVQKLPFSDETFELAICLGALEYVEDEKRAWREICRILKPGGKAIISGITLRSPYNSWDRWVYRRFSHLGTQGMKREYGTEEMYRRFGRDCGLYPVDVVYFDFSVFPAPLDRPLIGLSNRIADALDALGRTPMRKLGNGFLVKFVAGHPDQPRIQHGS